MIKKLFVTLIILFSALQPMHVFAFGSLDLISVKFNPETPGEDEDITISLTSYSVNLDSSEIIWYIDADPIKQGVGEKTFHMRTGNFGKIQKVKAVILSNLGQRFEREITVAPAEIDLLWEAQTYTPPFYKGKALPTFKSVVRVTAIPRYNQASSDPKDFVYNWKYNRTLSVGQGLGRNSTLIPMGFAGTPVPVSVEVSIPGSTPGGWNGSKNSTVTAGEAKVRFYEQAPLIGINFNKAVNGSVQGEGNQFTLKAVPYFFSTNDIEEHKLVYTWTNNNSNIVPGYDPTVVNITKRGTGEEQFNVNLRIQTPRHLLQQGAAKTVIILPEEKSI